MTMPVHSTRLGQLRRVAVALAALFALTMVTGCQADAEPRPLTAEEAQVLAQTRLRNDVAGVRQASFSVTDQSLTYEITAWIDFPAKIGYGTATSPDTDEVLSLAWSDSWIASQPGVAGQMPPIPPTAEGWNVSALLPEQSRLHAILAVLLTLGSGQPDNPLLLAQTDARWIREDTVFDTPVTVFRGPSSDEVDTGDPSAEGTGPLYWVTEDGTLLRMETVLGGSGELVVVEFTDADQVPFAEVLSQLGESAAPAA